MRASTVIAIGACVVFTVYAGELYNQCINNLVDEAFAQIKKDGVNVPDNCASNFNDTMKAALNENTNKTHDDRYDGMIKAFGKGLSDLLDCLKEAGATAQQREKTNSTFYEKKEKAFQNCHYLLK